MVYRKGERQKKHLEAAYAFAVDIPIAGQGLGQNLNVIAAEAMRAGGDHWSYCVRDQCGNPFYWCRVGVKDNRDAGQIAMRFWHLGARRP
jgi:hypothetical protein